MQGSEQGPMFCRNVDLFPFRQILGSWYVHFLAKVMPNFSVNFDMTCATNYDISSARYLIGRYLVLFFIVWEQWSHQWMINLSALISLASYIYVWVILLLRIDFDETNLLIDRKWLTTIESPSATIVAMTQVGATSIQSWRKIDTSPSLLGRTSNFKRYIYNVCDIFLFKHAFT